MMSSCRNSGVCGRDKIIQEAPVGFGPGNVQQCVRLANNRLLGAQ